MRTPWASRLILDETLPENGESVRTVVVATVLISGLSGPDARAQALSQQSTLLERASVLPRVSYELETDPDQLESSIASYRPNHWRTGALIGAALGVALGTVVLTTCDRDSNQDCPGWGRAAIAFAGSTGLGALIGALMPARPPESPSGPPQ